MKKKLLLLLTSLVVIMMMIILNQSNRISKEYDGMLVDKNGNDIKAFVSVDLNFEDKRLTNDTITIKYGEDTIKANLLQTNHTGEQILKANIIMFDNNHAKDEILGCVKFSKNYKYMCISFYNEMGFIIAPCETSSDIKETIKRFE